MAEKMPSSVKLGTRPISAKMRSYSSGLRPWAATSSGVIFGSSGLKSMSAGMLKMRSFDDRLAGNCQCGVKTSVLPCRHAFGVEAAMPRLGIQDERLSLDEFKEVELNS